jgi:hypothetical protein
MAIAQHTSGPWRSQGELEIIPGDRESIRKMTYKIYNESGRFAHIATAKDEADARLKYENGGDSARRPGEPLTLPATR